MARKPTVVLDIKEDISTGGAGGAKLVRDIAASTSSKWESPL
jgi:hypothetical protein